MSRWKYRFGERRTLRADGYPEACVGWRCYRLTAAPPAGRSGHDPDPWNGLGIPPDPPPRPASPQEAPGPVRPPCSHSEIPLHPLPPPLRIAGRASLPATGREECRTGRSCGADLTLQLKKKREKPARGAGRLLREAGKLSQRFRVPLRAFLRLLSGKIPKTALDPGRTSGINGALSAQRQLVSARRGQGRVRSPYAANVFHSAKAAERWAL
jgi:hypothetical protein